MNSSHVSNVAISTSVRFRQQNQERRNTSSFDLVGVVDAATIQDITANSTFSTANNIEPSAHQERQNDSDTYTPLAYEEADEAQLAEFFTSLNGADFALFGGRGSQANSPWEGTFPIEGNDTKRRRLSETDEISSPPITEEVTRKMAQSLWQSMLGVPRKERGHNEASSMGILDR